MRGSPCPRWSWRGGRSPRCDWRGAGGVVHDRAAEIVDGLLVHARACEEAAVHDGAEEDAEAVFVHMGSGEEVAEALLVHVRADCRGWLGTVTGERGTLRLSWE